jgi:putative IMPACT (imprinted ancient) family translation regulator
MPRATDYLTIDAGCDVVAELEVKRSRFICVLRRVDDEDAARSLVTELRRSHHSARHHCSAFVVGAGRELQRSNDDGEPAGTAGMPMLQTLLGVDRPPSDPVPSAADAAGGTDPSSDAAATTGPLSDVAAVVVRYFGGTLLGAGGLTRAYAASVSAALDRARFVRREHWPIRRVTLTHDVAGRLEHDLHGTGVMVRTTDYVIDGIQLTVAVPGGADGLQRFDRWLAERRQTAEDVGAEWIDVPIG